MTRLIAHVSGPVAELSLLTPRPVYVVIGAVLDGWLVGLYSPVWINGLLKNERGESSMNYIDGSSNIPSSYLLDATVVEPYE